MKFISRLRIAMARWLSPRSTGSSEPSTTSATAMTLDQTQLVKLSGLLSSLLSMDQNAMLNLAATLQLGKEIAETNLKAAEYHLLHHQSVSLPHRIYSPVLSHDGVSWVAQGKYADDSNLVGRGDCPARALDDFDKHWLGMK